MPFNLTKKQMIIIAVVAVVAIAIIVGLLVYFLTGGGGDRFDALEAHNKYRKKHGSPPLEEDAEITKVASNYAGVLAKNNEMKHSKGSGYGENLFVSSGTTTTADAVVGAWYNEIKDYDFKKAQFSMNTGHFTQVIWKSTKKLGCGIAKGKNLYVVCNYGPPGNVAGMFAANVLAIPGEGGGGAEAAPSAEGAPEGRGV